MSNTIIELKHSQVSGNTPATLANGEISINTADGRFFYKTPSGVIENFDKYPGPSGLDGELQFNDLGSLGTSDNLSFNKSTNTLTTKSVVLDKANVIQGNAFFESVKSNTFYQFGDGTRQYTANVGVETTEAAFTHANASFNFANTVSTFAQGAFDAANSVFVPNTFGVVNSDGTNIVANSSNTLLNIIAGGGVLISTNTQTKTITISAETPATAIFVDGGNFGVIDEAVGIEQDLGTITEAASVTINLGSLTVSGVLTPSTLIAPSYTVSTLPNPTTPAQIIFVSNESGGAVMAFSDGTNWRRFTDRVIVS